MWKLTLGYDINKEMYIHYEGYIIYLYFLWYKLCYVGDIFIPHFIQ